MINRLSLKSKVLMMVMLNIAVTVLFNGFSIYTNSTKEKIVQKIINEDSQSIAALNEMKQATIVIDNALNSLGYQGISPEKMKEHLEEIEKAKSNYVIYNKSFSNIHISGEEKLKYDVVESNWGEFEKSMTTSLEIFANGKPTANEIEQYHPNYISKLEPRINTMQENFEAIIALNDASIAEEKKNFEQTEKLSQIIIYGSVASQLIFGLILGFSLAIHLSKRFNSLTEQLTHEATNIHGTSSEMAAASSQLSASTTEQAAALQETVSAIDEVNAMVQQNAENSKKSIQSADISYSAVETGKKAIGEMIAAINDIKNSNESIMNEVDNSNKEFTEIVKVIHEIGQKTKVINDIVFQTKLLSFNASVEAARAGEHGKGFAVVAEEVGNLAQMSGNAAKEITDMLDSSIQKVETIVEQTKQKVGHLIRDGKTKVENGNDIALRCNESLEEIYQHVAGVKSMIHSIATASQEQSQGVSEITKAMNQMDQVTQENSAASQKTSYSADSLKQQADRIQEMIKVLSTTVHGEKGVATSHSTQSRIVTPQLKKETPKVKDLAKFRAKKMSEKNHSENMTTKKSAPIKVAQEKVAQKSEPAHVAMKEASGGAIIPTHDDPRFEDV